MPVPNFTKEHRGKISDMDLTLISNSGHEEDKYVIKAQQFIIKSFEISSHHELTGMKFCCF